MLQFHFHKNEIILFPYLYVGLVNQKQPVVLFEGCPPQVDENLIQVSFLMWSVYVSFPAFKFQFKDGLISVCVLPKIGFSNVPGCPYDFTLGWLTWRHAWIIKETES